jgi:hypothetical protein
MRPYMILAFLALVASIISSALSAPTPGNRKSKHKPTIPDSAYLNVPKPERKPESLPKAGPQPKRKPGSLPKAGPQPKKEKPRPDPSYGDAIYGEPNGDYFIRHGPGPSRVGPGYPKIPEITITEPKTEPTS